MRRISRLRQDQSGSILIIAAFGLLILVAMLSLAIDHGRNYLTESDMEAKLTAVSKSAGDEYIWWNIRRLVEKERIAQNISPGINDSTDPGNTECVTHVLCGHLNDGGSSIGEDPPAYTLPPGVKDALRTFVQNQMTQNGSHATVDFENPPIIKTSTGTHYLLFKATSNDQKNFNFNNTANHDNSLPTPPILAQSGVSIDITSGANGATGDTDVDHPLGIHVVFSLDWDSKQQLSGAAGDQAAQVFSLAKAVSDLLANSGLQNLSMGMTLGNVPTQNGLGGLYDNSAGYVGGRITGDPGNGRDRKQSRIYSYLGQFTATDTLTCAHPVMTYVTVGNGQCTIGPPIIIDTSDGCPQGHTHNPLCDNPTGIQVDGCGCQSTSSYCNGTGHCDDGSGSCDPNNDNCHLIDDGSGTGTMVQPPCDCDGPTCDTTTAILDAPTTISKGHWVAACALTDGPNTWPFTSVHTLQDLVTFSAVQQTNIDGGIPANPVNLIGYVHALNPSDPPGGGSVKASQAMIDYLNKNLNFVCHRDTPVAFQGLVPDGAYANAFTSDPDCKLGNINNVPAKTYWVEFTRADNAVSDVYSSGYGLSVLGRFYTDIPEGTYKVTMKINPVPPGGPIFPGFQGLPFFPGYLSTVTIPGDNGSGCGPNDHLCPPAGPTATNGPWAVAGTGNEYIDVGEDLYKGFYVGLRAPNGGDITTSCGVTCPNPNATPNIAPYIRRPGSDAESLVMPEMFVMGDIQMEASRQINDSGRISDLPRINLADFDKSLESTLFVGSADDGTNTGTWDEPSPAAILTHARTLSIPIGKSVDANGLPVIFPHRALDGTNVIWTPALEVARKDNSGGQIPQNNTFAPDQFNTVVDILKQGYTPYNITGGMAGNQCALLKWGAKQLTDVVGSGHDVKRNILYIGGFPAESNTVSTIMLSMKYVDYNVGFDLVDPGFQSPPIGKEAVYWFANSNVWPAQAQPFGCPPSPVPTIGEPGRLDDAPRDSLLKALDNPAVAPNGGCGGRATNILSVSTQQCFSDVKSGFLDNLFIITTGDTPEAVTAANAISSTNAPGSGCDHPCLLGSQLTDTTTADCTAQLLHCLSSPSHEVRKR